MNELEPIYLAARDLPTNERAAFLQQACAGDARMLARVEQMLSKAGAADQFFDEPPDPAAGALPIELNELSPSPRRWGLGANNLKVEGTDG
jgi:hypothetical protein